MTIPVERTRAVLAAREFLYDLLDPQKTPRVPRSVRRRAISVLRHFPGINDLLHSSRTCASVWGEPEWKDSEHAGDTR